jgi:hypothetical protein
MTASNLEAALAYAERGWPVFPVSPSRPGIEIGSNEYKAAKRPVTWLVRRGHHDATTDEAQIREWWAKVPRARVGLDCRNAGLLVIDHDDYKDNAAELPQLPPTLTAVTPQGGRHYYFQYPEGDWTDKREHGLDTKANGYVILPSADSGGYAWWPERGHSLSAHAAPVELPAALTEFLLKREEAGPGPQSIGEVNAREAFLIEEIALRGLGEYRVKGEDAKGRVVVELAACPFDTSDHQSPFKATIGIGSKGEPYAHCVMAGCGGKRWQDLPEPRYDTVDWELVRVSTGGEGPREWRGDELAVADLPPIEFLPVFGCEGYIPLGHSTILGAQPKGGKTTLMQSCMREWLAAGHTILYVTEEAPTLWKPRLGGDPKSWQGLTLLPVYQDGVSPQYLLERVRLADENIIIVDTARAIIKWTDENSATDVEGTVGPWLKATRAQGKTFIAVHHAKKGGGPLLEALSGSHALVGAFDQVLVLRRDEVTADQRRQGEVPKRNRRWLSGWGRFGGVSHLMYEKTSEGLELEGLMETLPFGDGE